MSFRCSIDSLTLTPCGSPFTVAPALADGAHSFRVQATDAAGNVEAAVRQRDFTVDAAVPDTSITAGPGALTNDSTPSFEFQSTKPGSTFACALDGGVALACDSPFQAAALADGAHTFTVSATDALGHPDPTPATRAFTVDTTAPLTTRSPALPHSPTTARPASNSAPSRARRSAARSTAPPRRPA